MNERVVLKEAVLYKNRELKGPIDYTELNPTPAALKISEGVRGIVSNVDVDEKRSLVNDLFVPETSPDHLFKFTNFEELKRTAGGPEMSKDELGREFPNEMVRSEYLRLRQMYLDLVDGVAIGSMWGNGFKVDKTFKELMKDKETTADKVDNFLGLKTELRGLGQCLLDSGVTDSKLINVLDMIQMELGGNLRDNDPAYYSQKVAEIVRVVIREWPEEDDWESKPKSEAKMLITYLSSIAGGAKELAESAERVVIPEDEKSQLKIARGALDYIEDSGLRFGDLLVSRESTMLINLSSSEIVSPEVKREINARLHLHYLYPLMYGAGGFMDSKIQGSIPNALQRAYDDKSELSMFDMTFFLRDGANGMEVGHFWDELMDINYGGSYKKIVDNILNPSNATFINELLADTSFWEKNGIDDPTEYLSKKFGKVSSDSLNEGSMFFRNEKSNYQYDSDDVRKQIVRKYLVSQMAGDKSLLSKGIELADKLIVATGEDATMNAAFAGHNDLAELILTEANIYDRKSKGKTIGSRRAMKSLVSLTPTWLRAISDEDAIGPIHCKEIDFDKMREPKGSEYYYYTAILMKKTVPYQQTVMEEGVDLKAVLSNPFWKGLYDQINKVAKYPSVIVDAKRGSSPGKEVLGSGSSAITIDIPGPVLRDSSGNEILDIVLLSQDGSVDMSRSGIMSMPVKPDRPPKNSSRATMDAYEKAMKAYSVEKKILAYRKEFRLREIVVEGIAHLSASRPELGMSVTQFRQLGTILVREMVLRDDKGVEIKASFLKRSQWNNIYEAYKKGISDAVASRKILKREMETEEEDFVAEVARQVIKAVTK